MHIIVVESTTISTVAYDSIGNLLQLEFRNRTVYHYFGVPASTYEALLSAPSKGGYFNQAIRGRYAYVRVCGLQTGADGTEVPPRGEHPGEASWHGR